MLTISILKNTNRAVSCSNADFTSIRPGSFIKFGNDSVFYTVAQSKAFMYIRDFEAVDPFTIKVNGEVGVDLLESDDLTISYKEYELLTTTPVNRGTGYTLNDILLVEGGTPSVDVATGGQNITQFKVAQVGPNGEILQVALENRGKYLTEPPFEAALIGGKGQGAIFQLTYKLIDVRTTVERTIQNITRNPNETLISLHYPLPAGVFEGKVSSQKWELILTSNYGNESKLDTNYTLTRDFSPIYNIPLLSKGTVNPELIANQALLAIERKIKELEDQIKALRGY